MAFSPLFIFFYFLLTIIAFALEGDGGGSLYDLLGIVDNFMMPFGFILWVLAMPVFFIIFIIDAWKSKLKLWAVLILLAAPFTMSIYWYLYIFRTPRTRPADNHPDIRPS
jgi:hypothetical protein